MSISEELRAKAKLWATQTKAQGQAGVACTVEQQHAAIDLAIAYLAAHRPFADEPMPRIDPLIARIRDHLNGTTYPIGLSLTVTPRELSVILAEIDSLRAQERSYRLERNELRKRTEGTE